MKPFIKIVLVVLAAYSVATAEPAQRTAMQEGVIAFAASIHNACTRVASPCTQGIRFIRSLVSSNPQSPDAVSELPMDHGPERQLERSFR